MRHFYPLVFLLVFTLLLLSACDAAISFKPFPEQNYLDNTAIPPRNTTTSLGEFSDQKSTSVPQAYEETPIIPQTISCEESFCQIDWPGWMIRPFSEPDRDRIDLTYPYASAGDGTLATHHGVEFPNPYGTPVRAAAAGKVLYAGNDDKQIFGPYANFYGQVVILQHAELFDGKDLFSLYGHLSTISVEEGEMIEVGDLLGQVGASGVAGGSHLHFEVRLGVNDYQRSTNPVLWFSPLANQAPGQTSALAGMILDSSGNPVPEASLTLEKLSDEGGVEQHYYFQTYAKDGVNSHPALQENFAMPDLPPGNYRLTYISGKMYEFNFTLEQGVLGFINLQVN